MRLTQRVDSPRAMVGSGLDEAASFATLDEVVALGITFFDTAFSYAGGKSERIVGRWLAGPHERYARKPASFDSASDHLGECMLTAT